MASSVKSVKAYEIVTKVLKHLAEIAKPGMTAKELDSIANEMVLSEGGTPTNLNYKPEWAPTPFPATLCVSINDEICHGVPTESKVLKDGDLVNFDIGVSKDGECGDAALTIGIGEISDRNKRLLWNAKKVLQAGIKEVRAGAPVKNISRAMEQCASQNGFVSNWRFCGHGIGKEMHEDPKVPNFYTDGLGEELLKVGQQICLEPQITYTDKLGVLDSDGWTWRTKDGKNSAFFEHQVEVLEDGYKILTEHIFDGKLW